MRRVAAATPELEPCRTARGDAVIVRWRVLHIVGRRRAARVPLERIEHDASRRGRPCAIDALRVAQSTSCSWLAARRTWSVARIAHCFHKVRARNHSTVVRETRLRPAGAIAPSTIGAFGRPGGTARPWPFLLHALGVDRTAAQPLALAFPVTAVFNDLLSAADGGYGVGAQRRCCVVRDASWPGLERRARCDDRPVS